MCTGANQNALFQKQYNTPIGWSNVCTNKRVCLVIGNDERLGSWRFEASWCFNTHEEVQSDRE